jgi:hypothetical protein
MSYDLRIWTTMPPKLADLRADAVRDEPRAPGAWALHVGEAVAVEPEDVPAEVAEALPGITYVVDLALHPVSAPSAAQKALRKVGMAIAREAHGAIEDPQLGEVTLGKGVRRYTALPADEDASLLTMGFWFAGGPLIEPSGAPGLLDMLSACLPEAMPARYGKFEPPVNRLETQGRDHLIAFMQQNWYEGGVYYPSAPVADFHLSVPQPIGAMPIGYRCGRLTVDVASGVLSQPGWHAAVVRLWRELVRFVQPFYSDVRHLNHYTRARGRHWINARTERHPTCSWWWSGTPVAGPVCARALGEPYIELWPPFATAAERIGGGLAHAAPSWLSDAPPLVIPPPPVEIQQVAPEYTPAGRDRQYPQAWPFGPTRA